MSFSQHLRNSTANSFHVCILLSQPREEIILSAQSNEDDNDGVHSNSVLTARSQEIVLDATDIRKKWKCLLHVHVCLRALHPSCAEASKILE